MKPYGNSFTDCPATTYGISIENKVVMFFDTQNSQTFPLLVKLDLGISSKDCTGLHVLHLRKSVPLFTDLIGHDPITFRLTTEHSASWATDPKYWCNMPAFNQTALLCAFEYWQEENPGSQSESVDLMTVSIFYKLIRPNHRPSVNRQRSCKWIKWLRPDLNRALRPWKGRVITFRPRSQ